MTDAAVLAGWVATGSEDRLAENLPVVPKRPVYRRKGQPVPRNRVPLEQIELESLRPNGHVRLRQAGAEDRSEEHTSELQSLMRISYAVFCLKKKKTQLSH